MLKIKKFAFVLIPAAGVACYYLLGGMALNGLPFGLRIQLQYVVLGFFAAAFGPLAGMLTGGLGELWLGLAGGCLWWSVVLAASVAGLLVGLAFYRGFGNRSSIGKELAKYLSVCLLASLLAWVVVCPALDLLLYHETLPGVLRRGAMQAMLAGVIMFTGGLLPLVAVGVARNRKKMVLANGFTTAGAPDEFDEVDRYIRP